MSEKKVKQKELKRRNIMDSISRIEMFVTNYNEDRDLQEVAIRLGKLDTLMENFEAIQGEYESFDDSEAFMAGNMEIRANVEETYFRVKGGLVSKIPPPAPTLAQPHPVGPVVPHMVGVKLPTISLPEFDGDLNEWLTFHDSFISLIHSSAEIPCIQKFQYLRSSLKGDALKLIESLTITVNNYAVAWEALLARYSNKYLLKKKHLQSLMVHSKLTGKSPLALRTMVEDFQRHVKTLTQLGEPTQHWSSLLVQLLSSRLDDRTLKNWEEYVSDDAEPTYTNLIFFLTKKSRAMESLLIGTDQASNYHSKQNSTPKQSKQTHNPSTNRINSFAATDTPQPACLACNQYHLLVKCPVFEKMPLKDRLNIVNTRKICSNCFRSDHFVRKCASTFSCRLCQKRHHTLLHPGFEATNSNDISNRHTRNSHHPQPTSSNFARVDEERQIFASTPVSSNAAAYSKPTNVLLSTAVIVIMDGYGKEHLARALLDSGSQCNLISERLCQQLRLPRHRIDQSISGVGESNLRVSGSVQTEIKSRIGRFSCQIDCLVLRHLTSHLPAVSLPFVKLNIPNELPLADPEFNVSRKVDLIIGAEYFFTMLKGGRINLGTSFPILAESVFGWVVSGKTDFETQNVTCCVSTLESIDRNLERFWKVDELDWSNITPSEQYCEEFYTKTVSRESCGRYMVKYPKKEQFSAMVGNSHLHAVRRLQSLERKLDKDEVLKKNYHDFLAEFLKLGHMRELAGDAVDPPNVFYLPHHAVLKDSSTTTKVRSVFDGSAKTSTGYSLNDALLIGPVIQDDLLSLVIRFRKYKVALLADIEKMYRQVSIHPDDRPLQRVLWRFSQDEPIAKYELTTVTYGLAPSSFLATRTLKQLADDEGWPGGDPARRAFTSNAVVIGSS
ncbi:uncharacterized protein LOC131681124 [Topomyia yanbarensis]|uniref:uncharacterized protein LOC131681124 n=1 Tax=Topomyia yanbarensis TaxID=2498891 RepID=UPI00273CE866|nr:uncharacterized protein LOC131681124 [Topomyia yanbarensis]